MATDIQVAIIGGELAGICIIIFYQLRLIHNSSTPKLRQLRNTVLPIFGKTNSLGEQIKTGIKNKYTDEQFAEMVRQEKERYRKERNIYWTIYITPILFAICSGIPFLFMIDSTDVSFPLTVSFYLFLLAIFSTMISMVLIKIYGIGTDKRNNDSTTQNISKKKETH